MSNNNEFFLPYSCSFFPKEIQIDKLYYTQKQETRNQKSEPKIAFVDPLSGIEPRTTRVTGA
jgi:hypothetical protein